MDFGSRLRTWFAGHARALPWRSEPRTPYGVLVSELMLQQTQVERVVPIYRAFMEWFPSLEALAAAPEEAVVAAWSGLGYYRRARLLHALARRVVDAGGELPGTAAELERLPGVGPYTAAAVASMAFGEATPAVDGNVARVAARVLGYGGDPRGAEGRRVVASWVRTLLERGDPGVVNEALMELGAVVCRPAAPRCARCPLEAGCRAHADGDPTAYPPPRPRRATIDLCWVAACCVDAAGRWLLRRVEEGPVLLGLWLPPLAEMQPQDDPVARAVGLGLPPLVGEPRQLPGLRHTITHRQIRVVPVVAIASGDAASNGGGGRWMDPRGGRFPTSTLLAKLVAAVGKGRSPRD